VFVKPHAVTPKVVELVKAKFEEVGFAITKEGAIDGPTIEKDLLVDNHYYAIANKASLSKPAELSPSDKAKVLTRSSPREVRCDHSQQPANNPSP
jgi:hypothetical protein